MTTPWLNGATAQVPIVPAPTGRRTDLPIAEGELDEHLARLVRRTSVVRQGFYFVVLLVALAGQVSGAVEALGIPLAAAIPAVAALELGGIVVLANADVRRRLGERAVASRLLSVSIAAAAVAFNWLAHANHLLGGFFAGMSALGYLVWLMHTENQRRDRLRIKGDLPPTTPAYEFVGHWLRHPWLTLRARAMAKANPRLGLYESLAAARGEIRRERRQSAIAKVLHRKIRSAVDPKTADIAIAVYDLDEIASRLAGRADYDGLTTLIAADLAPERLAPNMPPAALGAAPRQRGAAFRTGTVREAITAPTGPDRDPGTPPARGRATPVSTLSLAVREDIERHLGTSRPPAQRATFSAAGDIGDLGTREPILRDVSTRDLGTRDLGARESGTRDFDARDLTVADVTGENMWGEQVPGDISLRRRVHAALDATVLSGDQRDDAELIGVVFDELQLTDLERISAANYVHSWRQDAIAGRRVRAL